MDVFLIAVSLTSFYFSSLEDQISVQVSASEIFSPIFFLLAVTLENLLLPVELTGWYFLLIIYDFYT